jgi:ribosomal protein S1
VADIQTPGDAVKEGQVVVLKVLEVDPIHHRIVLAAIEFPDEPLREIPKPPIDVEGAGEAGGEAAAPEAQASEAGEQPSA